MMQIKKLFFIFLTIWALNFPIASAAMNPGEASKASFNEKPTAHENEKSIEAVENGLR